MIYLWLALGGAAGALCRYHVTRITAVRFGAGFPIGTFVVNTSGSLLLGLVVGWLEDQQALRGSALMPLLTTGFCGAYTTFSSFAFETVQLWQIGARARALTNVIGQLALGGIAAWMGLILGRLL